MRREISFMKSVISLINLVILPHHLPLSFCRFQNELPDPSAQPKLMSMKKDKDQAQPSHFELSVLILLEID
ncbi:hypothetical protein RchiOBHm_Chr6g0298361 [Rosa chinensis]|uniref:Uncharacterized protein n=1 Tax=Rosa chinensis TaxID=74649 RepID=A0A2P6PXY1_ROSCH|nr:hypothetical protein RchiOBHm_Chr6g0298361 [Rosa chinensis]